MDECHPSSVKLIKGFLTKFPNRGKDRALEVACGDARLTKDYLAEEYAAIDLFDRDPEVIRTVE